MFPLIVSDTDFYCLLFLEIPANGSINDQYFKSVLDLSKKTKSDEFRKHLTGFYLSKYNKNIRFSFFINGANRVEFIKQFFLKNDFKIVNDIPKPKFETFSSYCNMEKGNLNFRRYLQLITNVGLDLLEYDILYARKVVAKYRLEIVPQNKNIEKYFDRVLQKSQYYLSLSQQLKSELLSGLSFWIDDYNDWAHMFVVMLFPEDLDKSQFPPKKLINEKTKSEIVKLILGKNVYLDI